MTNALLRVQQLRNTEIVYHRISINYVIKNSKQLSNSSIIPTVERHTNCAKKDIHREHNKSRG